MQTMEDQIKEILATSTEEIKVQIQRQLKEKIIENLTWSLRDELSKYVNDFIQNEMQEEIKAVLVEAQPLIMEELRNSIVHISAGIGKQMIENANKNLSQSWNVKKIVEGLFN